MACRSCRRDLLRQLSSAPQRLSAAAPTEAEFAAIARHSSRAAVPIRQQQQRRGLQTTARVQSSPAPEKKSLIPESIKTLGGLLVKSTSQPYVVHRATETMYKACAAQANYTISEKDKRDGTVKTAEDGEQIGTGDSTWHNDFDLAPTFSTWSQVTMLHLYLIYARLRNMPLDSTREWQKQLTDHFFFDAEKRMDVTHGITSRALRHRYLKDLFVQWRGVLLSYDEGVARGDAVLAAALWRNVYKGRADVDPRRLAALVSWTRLGLRSLDQVPDDALFFDAAAALTRFSPRDELVHVDRPARELEGVLAEAPAAPAAPRQPAQKRAASA